MVLWLAGGVFLFLFAGALLAIGLDGLSRAVRHRAHLPHVLTRSSRSGTATTMLSYATHLAIASIAGIYLAARPGKHQRAVLHVVPPHRRDRAEEVMHALGHALRRWLVARFASMLVVGAVYLPPAFTLSFQMVAGAVAGAMGIILATPIAVVRVVLLQTLYVEDTLDDDVTVLGQ